MKKIIYIIVFLILAFNVFGACNLTELNSKALAYYKLEENNFNYVDELGNVDLTSGDAPAQAPYIIDFGQDFESTNTNYVYADQSIFNEPFISFSAWIEVESFPSHWILFGNTNEDANTHGWYMQLRSDGKIVMVMYNGAGANYQCLSNTSLINIGKTYHIVGLISDTVCTFYVNTTERRQSTAGGIAGISYMTSHNFTIGDFEFKGFENKYYDGLIDELFIYNGTLTEDCIDYLYDSGTPDSNQQYIFNNVTASPPNLSLIYPTNTTHYNNYNGSIIINDSSSSIANCSINDSDWSYSKNNASTFWWNNIMLSNKNYSIELTCWEVGLINSTLNFWIVVDTVNPTITLNNPINNSPQNTNFNIDIDYFDTYLWKTNTSIFLNTFEYRRVSEIKLDVGAYESGSITSLWSVDSIYYNITESNGVTPAIVFYMNITDIPSFKGLDFVGNYIGNPAHNVYLYIWNGSNWENLGQINSGGTTTINSSLSGSNYEINNTVMLLINHTSNGVGTHYLEIDYVKIYTDNMYFNNYSGELGGATEIYNVSSIFDINNIQETNYTVLMEATDTHTIKKFNENIEEIDVCLNNKCTRFYELKKADFFLEYPINLNLETIKDYDRFKFKFSEKNKNKIGKIKFTISSNKDLIYLDDSPFSCHFIIGDSYWFDLEPFYCIVKKIENKKYELELTSEDDNFITNSLGGLNYFSTISYFIIDNTEPFLIGNNTLSTNESVTLNINTSENVDIIWFFGLNCSGATTGLTIFDDNFSLSQSGLINNTEYFYNITLYDSINIKEYCINITTLQTILINATPSNVSSTNIEIDLTDVNFSSLMFISLLIYVILLFLALKFEDVPLLYFTLFLSVVIGIWIFKGSNLPTLIPLVFIFFNIYIFFRVAKGDV